MDPILFAEKCFQLNNSKLIGIAAKQYIYLSNLLANQERVTEQALQEIKNAWEKYAHIVIAHVREVQRTLPQNSLNVEQKQFVDNHIENLKTVLVANKTIIIAQVEEKRLAMVNTAQNVTMDLSSTIVKKEPQTSFEPWWPDDLLVSDFDFVDLTETSPTFSETMGGSNLAFNY